MVDLNEYLKKFKLKYNLKDFSDEFVLSDRVMLNQFVTYLRYKLKRRYYKYNLGE